MVGRWLSSLVTPRRLLSPLVEWLSRTHLEERKFSVYAFYEAAINGRKQSGGNTFIRYERIVCPPIGLKRIWRGKGCGGTFCLCLDFQLIVDRRSSPFGDLFPPKISSFRALDLLLSAVRGYDNGGNFRSSWWMDLRGERGIACAHDLEKFLL